MRHNVIVTSRCTTLESSEVAGERVTTIHRYDADGGEAIETTGTFQILTLRIEDRGHEMVLPR